MARLEDTLKKIYGLPESTTPTMPRVPMLGMETGAVINDAEKQRIMNSLMRVETGAVINDSEMEFMDQTYFPQPGDTAETANEKAQALNQALQQLEQENTPQSMGFLNRARDGRTPETGAVINEAERLQSSDDVRAGDPGYNKMGSEASVATGQAINELMMQKETTTDPDDIQHIDNLINNMQLSANAPMNPQAMDLASQGQGPDTLIGHLEEGDVVIPPDLLADDPEFESYLERKFNEYDINPEDRVATTGIAGLYNPITGAQQFGFFKKLAKGIKKAVKVIAPFAQFIPGPIGAAASIYNKGKTIVDVARGKANPLALLTVAGPMRTGQSIGDSFRTLTGPGGGITGLKNQITSGFSNFRSDPGGTISGLFKSQNPTDYTKLDTGEYVNKITGETISATDFGNLASRSGSGIQRLTRGLQGGLFGTEGMAGGVTAMPGQSVDDIANSVPGAATRVERLRASGMSDADIMKDLQFSGYAPQNVTGGFTDQAGNVYSQQQMMDAGLVNSAGQLVSQVAGQFMPTGQQQGGGFLSGLMGGQGGGMLGGLGSLAQMGLAGGIAGKLGKLAYDEAKDSKGVSLSPVVAMDATGRYNLEAEMARRMGQQAPNPTEFGLLPANTFPQLSGGQKLEQAFDRMNGQINGEGTETSDDIPAMLSDGEFVMTGQAVRGAGAYKMKNDSGIVTLTPSGSPSRDAGTETMYNLMEAFSSRTGPT